MYISLVCICVADSLCDRSCASRPRNQNRKKRIKNKKEGIYNVRDLDMLSCLSRCVSYTDTETYTPEKSHSRYRINGWSCYFYSRVKNVEISNFWAFKLIETLYILQFFFSVNRLKYETYKKLVSLYKRLLFKTNQPVNFQFAWRSTWNLPFRIAELKRNWIYVRFTRTFRIKCLTAPSVKSFWRFNDISHCCFFNLKL